MTITVEKETPVRVELEIQTPSYYKNKAGAFYAILEDETIIDVFSFEGYNSLSVITPQSKSGSYERAIGRAVESSPSTEEEFCAAMKAFFANIHFPCQL